MNRPFKATRDDEGRLHVATGVSRAVLGGLLLALTACQQQPAAQDTTPLKAETREKNEETHHAKLKPQIHEDLRVGYTLLADTLSDESDLGKLDFFKKVTFDAPNEAIDKLMKRLSEASERRADQLPKLRQMQPSVTGKPNSDSLIGDAINAIAKDFGKDEMMSRAGGFDVRFVLIQAQATRMVASMAKAIARFDPNPERKAWLQHLAREYEGYRGDLIAYLGGEKAEK